MYMCASYFLAIIFYEVQSTETGAFMHNGDEA